MSLRCFAIALILAPTLTLAQLNPNTVTVTASRNSAAQQDQAVFNVSVGSGTDKNLDDIARTVAAAGITASNLVGISGQFQGGLPLPSGGGRFAPTPAITWTFQLTVPIANVKTETATLNSLLTSQSNNGLVLSFILQSSQASTQQFGNCDLIGLMADARSQAQAIAGAGGLVVTSVVGLQRSVSQPPTDCSLTATFALGFSGNPGSHTIAINAARTLTSQPDQVGIGMNVISSVNAGLNDVTGALATAGISGASFAGVGTVTDYSSSQQGRLSLAWDFTTLAPLATLKTTLAQLLEAQASLSKPNVALNLSFDLESLQTSTPAQPACPQAALISDATGEAQRVAAAAGVSLGTIQSLSTSLPPIPGNFGTIYDPYASLSLGLGYASFTYNPAPSCTLAVQFQLN